MASHGPDVSVVVATTNRPARLARLLDSLRAQTLPRTSFEVIVVTDGSGQATRDVLRNQEALKGLDLRVVEGPGAGSPAAARNAGWPHAKSPVVAFTDDDCEADPHWLAAGLRTMQGHPRRLVQGPTIPNPAEMHHYDAFAYSVDVKRCGPSFETTNMFYPRELLREVGGFDEQAFSRGGEDTDLARRALASGAHVEWAPAAVVRHGVIRAGAFKLLRRAWRWDQVPLLFRRHPEMRRERYLGVFWHDWHAHLAAALLGVALPRRFWQLKIWLVRPYLRRTMFPRRSGIALLPWYLLHDVVEVLAIVRGAIRARVPLA